MALSEEACFRIIRRLQSLERPPTAITGFMSLVHSDELDDVSLRRLVRGATADLTMRDDLVACFVQLRLTWLCVERDCQAYFCACRIAHTEFYERSATGTPVGAMVLDILWNWLRTVEARDELLAVLTLRRPDWPWSYCRDVDLAELVRTRAWYEHRHELAPRILPGSRRWNPADARSAPDACVPYDPPPWRGLFVPSNVEEPVHASPAPCVVQDRPAGRVLAPPSKRLPTWQTVR